jgi:hypothetical protein
MITHECSGCGDPTDTTATINGQTQSVCANCLHDSVFTCPDCVERFWMSDGVRMTRSEIVCGPCSAFRPLEIVGRMRELIRDQVKSDDFDQVRR